jgi:hypothetical protein
VSSWMADLLCARCSGAIEDDGLMSAADGSALVLTGSEVSPSTGSCNKTKYTVILHNKRTFTKTTKQLF